MGFFKSVFAKKAPPSQSLGQPMQLNDQMGVFVRRDPAVAAGMAKRSDFMEKRFLDQVFGIDSFVDVQPVAAKQGKGEKNGL